MAQGIAYNKEEILKVLEPYFKLGCSVRKACAYAGLDETTVIKWYKKDPTLSAKIQSWQNEINELARRKWREQIEQNNYVAIKDWLSKKEKDEFSDRQEVTGSDGGALNINVINYKQETENDSSKMQSTVS